MAAIVLYFTPKQEISSATLEMGWVGKSPFGLIRIEVKPDLEVLEALDAACPTEGETVLNSVAVSANASHEPPPTGDSREPKTL